MAQGNLCKASLELTTASYKRPHCTNKCLLQSDTEAYKSKAEEGKVRLLAMIQEKILGKSRPFGTHS